MININDVDEKKMIIAYQKLCSNKTIHNLVCNSSVYCEWLMKWRSDFVIDGKCLKMWHQKFVVSANKHKQGIETPESYKEYNKFINDVTGWMNSNYEMKYGRKNNKRKFAEMLIEHRKICAGRLEEQLKECKQLSDYELIYNLPEKTNKRFTELISYSLMIHNGEIIFKGSYDEMKDYMTRAKG